MQHLLNVNEFNQRHMEFISSNSSAGASGKETRPAGPTPIQMSNQEYMRQMSDAFNDQKIAFKKITKLRKKKPATFFRSIKERK